MQKVVNAISNEERQRTSLRLARALLREATYLPDPISRAYAKQCVLSRFRRRQSEALPLKQPVSQLSDVAFSKLMSNGRKDLRLLANANRGDKDALFRVLCLAYGRVGKRRHQLMASLKQPDSGTDTHHQDPIVRFLEMREYHSDIISQVPKLSLKFELLLKSQIRALPPTTVRNNPRSLQLRIPEKNSWDRKLPVVRVKNQIKDWYASLLDKVHAPLPEAEWEMLKKLAHGQIAWEGSPKRRPNGLSSLEEVESYSHAKPLETAPASAQLPNLPSTLALLRELNLDLDAPLRESRSRSCSNSLSILQRKIVDYDKHRLDNRMMRRLWQKVFSISPKMTWNSEKATWDTQWGHRPKPRMLPIP